MTERNEYELLSKADVMREYKFPADQLDADLRDGKIPYFTSTGERAGSYFPGRFYIVRGGVERRIQELTSGEASAS